MSSIRRALGAFAATGVLLLGAPFAQARPPHASPSADFAGAAVSPEVRNLVDWVVASDDHRGRAFALVDKKAARLYVFSPQAQLVGTSPVLLGLAVGDHSAPGVGDLPPKRIPAAQ